MDVVCEVRTFRLTGEVGEVFNTEKIDALATEMSMVGVNCSQNRTDGVTVSFPENDPQVTHNFVVQLTDWGFYERRG